MQIRYDEERKVFRDCKFCHGEGCMACPAEAVKAYLKAFPDGPKPIATFKTDNPEDIERAKKMLGKDALEKAFGPGGGEVDEVIENLAKAEG